MGMSKIKQFELQLKHRDARERAEWQIQQAPPILAKKIDFIRNVFEDEWRRSLVGRYQVAVIIKEIYDDVNDNNGAVYGAKAVEVLKDLFGWDKFVIYQAIHVAETFTPEQIEEMASLRTPLGKPVSYSHVMALATVEDDRQREELLKNAVKEGWSAQKLTNAVALSRPQDPDKVVDRRGRPLAKPKDFDAVLNQQELFAKDFLSRNLDVWSDPKHSLSAKADELENSHISQERVERLKRHGELMDELSRRAKERANEAMGVHRLFQQVLKERTEKENKLSVAATPGSRDRVLPPTEAGRSAG
jgi:hypothetical protein